MLSSFAFTMTSAVGITGEDLTTLEGLEARDHDVLRGTNGKHRFEFGNDGS
jgi:cell division protein FtsI (penicillin-binding protein 3)